MAFIKEKFIYNQFFTSIFEYKWVFFTLKMQIYIIQPYLIMIFVQKITNFEY